MKKVNRMKTCFKISPACPLKPSIVKDTVRFCLREVKAEMYRRGVNKRLPLEMIFKVQNTQYSRSGLATRNDGQVYRSRVLLKIGHVTPGWEIYRAYQHREDCPRTWIEDRLEMFVHLTAHELGHALYGFEGDMIGEYQCERLAHRVLEAWRMQFRPAACMI